MDLVVGTAGHIDHGKTTLVKALTGVDADRLPEEKQRGITIDLGFAELRTPEATISFVDVPGHERFVKNMLAGAGGIDLVLLVVAADEGVMPQTREHFEICRLLDTRLGIIVITKSDVVDEEFLDLVELDVAELVEGSFLENAPVIRASAKTGTGISEVSEALRSAAVSLPERDDLRPTRLPVDRSFSVKGFGAVVTGTLVSGKISVGDEMELLPGNHTVRVRGLQSHGESVETAHAGRRTAVNLGGIDHSDIERGMVLAERGAFEPAHIFDAEVEVLPASSKALRSRQRVRVHIGTVEALARVDVLNESRKIEAGGLDLVQIRLETPVVASPSDRFIIRQYSPQVTIAGGRVLDGFAHKHRRKEIPGVRDALSAAASADGGLPTLIANALEAAGSSGTDLNELVRRTGFRANQVRVELERLVAEGVAASTDKVFLKAEIFAGLRSSAVEALAAHHASDPLSPGMSRELMRDRVGSYLPDEVFRAVLSGLEGDGEISVAGDTVRLSTHSRDLAPEAKAVLEKLSGIYSAAGLEVPSLQAALDEASKGTRVERQEARKIFQMLVESADLLKVTDDLYFSRASIGGLTDRLRSYAESEAENRLISVPEFKDLAGISRKYAIPLLEYLDAIKVTRRAGEKRLIL